MKTREPDSIPGFVREALAREPVAERDRIEVAAAHLAAIVGSTDDAVIGKNLAGIVTSWNAGAEKIFGYSALEMIGQSVMRIVPADRVSEEAGILDALRRGGSARHLDTVRMHKNGSAVDVSITISAIRDATGKIVGASKVARDITERKRAEVALCASEGRYRTLFEYAPDGLLIADPQSTYLDANASICRMLGYTRAELVGLHASEIVVKEEIQHIAPALQVIKSRSAYDREWKFRRKDGSIFEAEVIATVMPDGNLLGIVRDITERKLAECRLGTLSAVSRVLADAVSLAEATPGILRTICEAEGWGFGAIWEMDGAAGVLRCTESWHSAAVAGSDLATLAHGMTFAAGCGLPGRVWASGEVEIIPDVKEDRNYPRAPMVLAAGLRSALGFPILVGKEVTGVIEFAACEVQRPDGELKEMFAAIGQQLGQFIQRRRAEEQVGRLNAELEQRVVERTAQLESANRELEAFSYSVSHDLRAPLRAMDGFSQAVQEDFGPLLPPEGQRQLQVIRKSAQGMGELIDDLLTFSRLSRQPLNKQTMETGQLVRAVLTDLNVPAEGSPLKVRIGPLPPSEGDRALLKQVWVNLISNAVKYSRKREHPVIEIGCVEQNGQCVFFVRDNGSGFDMRYADKLFGVFQRLHRAEDYEGTGVGLAIVQRIIHRHGGRVWADAAVDRGATFYFTLEGATKP